MRMDSSPFSVYLAPGDYFVGDARHRVRTLLGSCVSITLWQPERRIGAMSHFLLAERSLGRPARTRGVEALALPDTPRREQALDARYGRDALTLMLQRLAALGVSPAECEAKLFGGGDMFPEQSLGISPPVGRRNGDAAHALLRTLGIRVVSHSLFGVGHRKIVFDIATGDVWAWQDDTSANDLDGLAPAPPPVQRSTR